MLYTHCSHAVGTVELTFFLWTVSCFHCVQLHYHAPRNRLYYPHSKQISVNWIWCWFVSQCVWFCEASSRDTERPLSYHGLASRCSKSHCYYKCCIVSLTSPAENRALRAEWSQAADRSIWYTILGSVTTSIKYIGGWVSRFVRNFIGSEAFTALWVLS
jgi:hypothetical protein